MRYAVASVISKKKQGLSESPARNALKGDEESLAILLEETEKLLEIAAELQPGINTRQGKQLVRRFALEISRYFRKLSQNIPVERLPRLISIASKVQEAAGDDLADDIAGGIAKKADSDLEYTIEKFLSAGYALGGKQAIQAVKFKGSFNVVNDQAVKWLKSRGAEQVKNITEVTRSQLRTILIDGAHKGQSVQQIAKRIRDDLAQMADAYKGRSYAIAQNEVHEAMSESALQTYKRLEVEYKSWSSALEPCEICQGNESAGIISMERAFPSGHYRPPAHPRCLCVLTPERIRD